MLGRVDTKKLFPMRMIHGTGIKDAPLTQYVLGGVSMGKLFPFENARWGWYI